MFVLQLGQFRRCVDQNAQQGAEVRSRQELPTAASQTAAQNESHSARLAVRGEQEFPRDSFNHSDFYSETLH